MARKKKTTTVTTMVVRTPNAPTPKQGGKAVGGSKKAKAAKKKQLPNQTNLRKWFVEASLRPDLTGPWRQPRFGGGTRTGLGFDQTVYTITGNASYPVQGVQASTQYFGSSNAIHKWAVLDTTTGLGSGTWTAPQVQFPNTNNMADVNITGCVIIAYYTGNPLNVQGECIFGSCIPIADTSSYATMYQYPGTIKMPVARLIEHPMAISFRKMSSTADEFVPYSSGNADCDLPFLFVSGIPTGGTLVIECFRSFEYRSSTVSGYVVPYERVGDSHAREADQYQDARADIAQMPSVATPMSPEGWMSGIGRSLIDNLNPMAVAGAGLLAAWQYRVGRNVRAAREGGPFFRHIGRLDEIV